MQIFGIEIEECSRGESLKKIEDSLLQSQFFRVTTMNPEFLLLALEDEAFRNNLQSADVRIADGFGVVLAGLLQGKFISRFPGADLMEEVLKLADEKGYSLFLAVNKDGLSSYQQIKESLFKKYPSLKVNGLDLDPKILNPPFIISENIVLCNFGAPEQEYFLENLRIVGQGIHLVMGVGGSFDYMTGKLKRAPKWMRKLGLEWLWRLTLQPKRWKRIWNAVVVFPTKVLIKKVQGSLSMTKLP